MKSNAVLQKKDYILLFLILIVALLLRLYKINTPLADLHSWRQADTAAVARNFVKNGVNFLLPQYDDLSNIQSGLENPHGYRMVEFPLYNGLFALLYRYLPVLPLEVYGRLISIVFSLIIIACIYCFLFHESNRLAAFAGSLIYAVFPFFIFFSRVVLPETTAAGLTFISLFLLYKWSQNKKKFHAIFFIFSLILFSLSLLIKPTVVFFFFSLVYLFFAKYKSGFIKKIDFYAYCILVFTPLLLWRLYIRNYPEGIPVYEWLLTKVNTPQGLQTIFLKPAFFRWIFFERINNLILGGYAAAFLILGILKKNKTFFLHSILISSLVYLFVFQGGNVQHEYYQTLILPAIALFSGLGISFIFSVSSITIHQYFIAVFVAIILTLSAAFSFYKVKDYYHYSQDLVNVAKIITSITQPNNKIITDTIGDTTLLFLSERRGYPAPFKDLEKLKQDGASYFITFSKDVIDQFKKQKKYSVFFENDKFAMFVL